MKGRSLQKLRLRCQLSLGDIAVLTAAVRDLHRCYPGRFLTDVETSCGGLWENNPHLTSLSGADPSVQVLDLKYPLIRWSNQIPLHFLHGFIDHLNSELQLEVKATEFRGDIHLSPRERRAPSPLARLARRPVPYWLILAGGKHDLTVKWWDHERYQAVVDHFKGRVQFVQLGQAGDFHPALKGAIDLRGRTSIRELIHWVHHAQGVVCGVTGLMHLAAAVPSPDGSPGLRPCVVIAGGREPAHWEAYPGHAFLQNVGQLACCAGGGCWRSRTLPLGDGDPRDHVDQRCLDVVGSLPRCMDRITANQVIGSIESYLSGRRFKSLNSQERRAATAVRESLLANPVDLEPITAGNVSPLLDRFIREMPPCPADFKGRGIVVCAGGTRFFPCAWVLIRMLRHLGCRLPVELWYLGPREMTPAMKALLTPYGVRFVDGTAHPESRRIRRLGGWELKVLALIYSRFRHVILLDADNVPVRDPAFLLDSPEYQEHGALFWPDNAGMGFKREVLGLLGMAKAGRRPVESGQVVVDKVRCWEALQVTLWINRHSEFFYPMTLGDKETFRLGFARTGKSYAMPQKGPQGRMRQYDFQGRLLFQHRNTDKWGWTTRRRRIPGFRYEALCCAFLDELRDLWRTELPEAAAPVAPGSVPASMARKRGEVSLSGQRCLSVRRPSTPLTVVTLFDRSMALVGSITSKAWRRYCETNGYTFVCHESVLDATRHPAWSKIRAVLEALKLRNEPVLWVDADTIPMCYDVRAESLLSEDVDLVFASDFNGLNSGVFLARPTEWVMSFLKAVWFLGDVRRNPDSFGDKWEQNTIKAMMKTFRYADAKVQILPERVMNASVASYEPGDFLIHLGGMSNAERLDYLRSVDLSESL